MGTTGIYGFGATGTADLGLSRDAAGVLDIGNGTAGDTSGTGQATAFVTKGTNGGITGTEGTGANTSPSTTKPTQFYANTSAQRWAMQNHNNSAVFLIGATAQGTAGHCWGVATNGYDATDTTCGSGGGTINTGAQYQLPW